LKSNFQEEKERKIMAGWIVWLREVYSCRC